MEKFRDNSFFDDLSDAFFSVTSPRYDKTVLKRIFFVTFVALLLFIIQYGFPQNLTLSQFADLPVKLILTVILLTFVILYFISFISGYIVITLFYAVEFIAFSVFFFAYKSFLFIKKKTENAIIGKMGVKIKRFTADHPDISAFFEIFLISFVILFFFWLAGRGQSFTPPPNNPQNLQKNSISQLQTEIKKEE
jgi:hypothetical protein